MGSAAPRRFCRNRFRLRRSKGLVQEQFLSLDVASLTTSWDWVWFNNSGVTCVQLVGSMSMAARDAAISRFTNEPDCRIFLMSLKAGGVALNLTVASHVFLMDPWWNPAVERQAQDRIHRIGQYKPIRIVRFVIENTIEERILKLQEKKELVFEGTVGGSSEALAKLTEADLRVVKKRKADATSKMVKSLNKKNSGAPKRPPSAFFVFMDDFRKSYKENFPDNKSVSVVGKAGGEKWKAMSESEKAPYVAKAVKKKAEYEKAKEEFDRKLSGDGAEKPEESEKSSSEVHNDAEQEASS
ncbi:hypothetical protein Vadar_011955 [Vaccinium darrowii]|uniref:Uncharacterized protein n=1 Tax=Vaccinium darrowii TaxID=229202 RepID=A0ACB7Z3H7_9ERIC|nr:hypothetical protein Vadar_011955 [Vaccinium darrowii]